MKAFLKEKWKDILVAVIAGLLVYAIPQLLKFFFGMSANLLTIQIIAIVIIVIALVIILVFSNEKRKEMADNLLINKYEKQIQAYEEQEKLYNGVGIVKMLPSTMEGEGSTSSILNEVDKSFYFMGIAGTKWIQKADNFEKTMRKLTAIHGSKVRFILLNPMSVEARNMSLAEGKSQYYMRDLVLNNLRTLKTLKDELGINLEVKLFSHMPVFRIAIVDEEKIYFGQYRINSGGENLSQIVLQGKDKMLYRELSEYYSIAWDNANLKCFDFDKIDDQSYLDSLK